MRNSARLDQIVQILEAEGKLTYHELANIAGLSTTIIKNARYMSILVAQNRIRIVEWRRNKAGPMLAVYAAGPGRSVKKPTPLSATERSRRRRTLKRILTKNRGFTEQLFMIMAH